MSAEHFKTIFTADARTAEDGRSVEWKEGGTGYPRLTDNCWHSGNRSRTFATVYLYAEDVLKICAQTIEHDPMDGLTGDHPEKRKQVAELIRSCAYLTRLLALDDAYDSSLTDGEWQAALEREFL